jgi:hypothetical protein
MKSCTFFINKKMDTQRLYELIDTSPRDHLLVTIKLYEAMIIGIGPATEGNLRRTILSTKELRILCSHVFSEVINTAKVLYVSTGERSLISKKLFDFLVELSNLKN